jgi:hypothetical protein
MVSGVLRYSDVKGVMVVLLESSAYSLSSN